MLRKLLKNRHRVSVTVLLGLLLVCRWTYAAETLVVNATDGEFPLGLHLDILEDSQHQWTLDDVRTPELAEKFTASPALTPNFGYTSSAYWARIQIRNTSPNVDQWRLEMGFQNMNSVELYTPSASCGASTDSSASCPYNVRRAGNILPFASREILSPAYVFHLTLPLQQVTTVYLRFANAGTMLLPLTLWSSDAFTQKVQSRQLRFGLYYGILLIMAVYNLSIFFVLRDASYGYYVAFIVVYAFIQASVDGLAFQYLWPNIPVINKFAIPFFSSLALVAMLQFLRAFVGSATRLPRLDRATRSVLAFGGLLVLLSLFVPYSVVIQPISIAALVGFILMITSSVLAWRQGFVPARYFLLAWGIFVFTTSLRIVERLFSLPGNALLENSDRIGTVLLVVVLSLAVSSRFSQAIREKDLAQAEATHLQAELNAALQQAKQELESRVASQNEALGRANSEIEILNQVMQGALHLSDASTGLTGISAQMAAESDEISQQVGQVSGNSQQISEGFHNVSVSTEQMTAGFQEFSHTVNAVSDIIQRAVQTAQTANAAISDLAGHSQDIGNISKVITNITQQTNLLALNATIEAARAGDFGRGFTVVAQEVKTLAKETSQSAEDITHKIDSVQSSSAQVAEAIEEVVVTITSAAELVMSMTQAIDEQRDTTDRISQTIHDAANGSEGITQAIGEIAATTQVSAERAATIQTEAEELSKLAEQLRQLVNDAKGSAKPPVEPVDGIVDLSKNT